MDHKTYVIFGGVKLNIFHSQQTFSIPQMQKNSFYFHSSLAILGTFQIEIESIFVISQKLETLNPISSG